MPRIAVYSIAKNEEANVAEWVSSTQGADEVVLVDTGSTDGTIKIARDHTLSLYDIRVDPFRFDDAFNAALSLVDTNIDICVPLHLDERLLPGWREELIAAWAAGGRRFTFEYQWGPDLSFRHDRIHARRGFRWVYPAHETVVGDGMKIDTDIRIEQVRDETKDRSQDAGLIELGWRENPHDSRPTYYWARELYYLNRWEEARALFPVYLRMPGATFDQERSEACRIMAKMVWDHDRESWLLKAAAEAPQRREPWSDLAHHYQEQGRAREAAGAAARALSIYPDRTNSFHLDAAAWDDAALTAVLLMVAPRKH